MLFLIGTFNAEPEFYILWWGYSIGTRKLAGGHPGWRGDEIGFLSGEIKIANFVIYYVVNFALWLGGVLTEDIAFNISTWKSGQLGIWKVLIITLHEEKALAFNFSSKQCLRSNHYAQPWLKFRIKPRWICWTLIHKTYIEGIKYWLTGYAVYPSPMEMQES